MLASAGNGVALLVQQALDAHHALDITFTIHALAGIALDRLQLRKLGFPETQNVGRKAAQARDLADAEVKLFRDQDFAGLGRLSVALLFGTHGSGTHADYEKQRPFLQAVRYS